MVYLVEGNGMPTSCGLWSLYPGAVGAGASGGFADRHSSMIRWVGLTFSSVRPLEFAPGVLFLRSLSLS